MRTTSKPRNLWIFMAALITAAGCQPAEVEPAADIPVVAPEQAQPTQQPVQLVATEEMATQTIEASDVPKPTPASVTSEPRRSPTPQPERREDESTRYRVVFVEEDDVLNVRDGPGVGNSIVGTLAPGAGNVRATGQPMEVSGSPWLPITDGTVAGWVNLRFLTEQLASEDFCRAGEVTELASAMRKAVDERDGALLAELVDPQGGLRINRHWWNPTVYIAQDEVAQQFSSTESRHWGFADGSGDSIDGSFGDVVLPLLDRNLLPANEFGCDEIVHGGTAGMVRLPASYDGIHFISLHRAPASDGFELDWGTWVVGIERRQGEYFISFLVHYEWEI